MNSELHLYVSITQLMRYALVGVVGNSLGYSAYLVITYVGATPKITMSIVYICITIFSFFANKKYTFDADKGSVSIGVKYIISHLFGYLINLSILAVMVDRLGYPHQLVQLCAIIVVAMYLFFMLKLFVFSKRGIIK
jgi:putative flippase GtrA